MREKSKCLKLQKKKKVKTKKSQPEETTLVLFFFSPSKFTYLPACMSVPLPYEAGRGLDYLELELQIGTNYCVGAGN